MRIFCILILISSKLFASPIGNGKTMFSSDAKTTIGHEFHVSIINIASFEKGLNEAKDWQHYSAHTIS
jgi:hypothetical protein